jgi:hypothetical protein
MMTRKDYVKTAQILNNYVDEIDFLVLSEIADEFAGMFEDDNPNFNYQKFIDAVFAEVSEGDEE